MLSLVTRNINDTFLTTYTACKEQILTRYQSPILSRTSNSWESELALGRKGMFGVEASGTSRPSADPSVKLP